MPQDLAAVPYKMGRIKALFIGSAKSGKSISAMTFPKPMYIFDLDGRIRSLRNFWSPNPEALKDVTFDTYRDFDSFAAFFDKLETNCSYKTIVIDSLTSLCNMAIRYGLKSRGEPMLSSSLDAAKKRGEKVIAGVQIPAWDEWNMEASVLREILYIAAKKLTCNVILTAHLYHTEEQEMIDNKMQMVTKYHVLTGGKKAAASLPTEFDEVYHFRARDIRRRCVTRPTDSVPIAGTTLKLPGEIDVKIDPKRKMSAGNGCLYHKIVEHCEEIGLIK